MASRKYIDLTGTKVGEWKVLRRLGVIPKKGPHAYYSCVCKCGKKSLIASTNLVRKKTLSCRKCANFKKRGIFRVRLAAVYCRIKKSAKVRNLKMNITHEYVLDLMWKQHWKCAITGLPLQVLYDGKYNATPSTASLDRIDSSKGYIRGNVQWVYKPINMMKWKLSQEEFIRLCKIVARRHS